MKPTLPVKGIRQPLLILILCLFSLMALAKPGKDRLYKGILSPRISITDTADTAPVAGDDYTNTEANRSVTASFVVNDWDPNGDSLSIAGVTINVAGPHTYISRLTSTGGGTFDMYTDGTFTYTPPLNFSGSDQVIYTICEVTPLAFCTTATIYVSVKPGNFLPVSLSQFTGKRSGKDNFLQWVTAQENNSDHFDLEQCTDNTNFIKIARLTAKGNSSLPTSYSYVHYAPAAPVNYYRLKQVDKDGRAVYSKVVAIKADGTGVLLQTVYPNPFLDKIELAITTEHAGMLTVRLYDNNGRTVAVKEVKGSKGLNTITLNGLNNLQPGAYFIDISGTINIVREKLMKVE